MLESVKSINNSDKNFKFVKLQTVTCVYSFTDSFTHNTSSLSSMAFLTKPFDKYIDSFSDDSLQQCTNS